MMYCLDTNICIYALKGTYPHVQERIASLSPSAIKIPAMVLAELLLGARRSSNMAAVQRTVRQFAAPFEVLPFDRQAAIEYSELRADLEKKGTPIGPNDLVIASIVVAARGTLVTHNVKEFGRIPHLLIDDWAG